MACVIFQRTSIVEYPSIEKGVAYQAAKQFCDMEPVCACVIRYFKLMIGMTHRICHGEMRSFFGESVYCEVNF